MQMIWSYMLLGEGAVELFMMVEFLGGEITRPAWFVTPFIQKKVKDVQHNKNWECTRVAISARGQHLTVQTQD